MIVIATKYIYCLVIEFSFKKCALRLFVFNVFIIV